MRNFEAVAQRIDAGLTVDHADVVEMFEILKAGGVAAKLTEVQAELDDVKEGRRQANLLVASLDHAGRTASERLSAARAENEVLRAERDGAKDTIATRDMDLAALKAENEKAVASLEEAAARFEHLNRTIDELQAAALQAEPVEPQPVASDGANDGADTGPSGSEGAPQPAA